MQIIVIVCVLLTALVGILWLIISIFKAKFQKSRKDRTDNIAIALALAGATIDGWLKQEELSAIKSWAKEHIPYSNSRKFHSALTKTASFFLNQNEIDIEGMCQELVLTSKIAYRYDIIELIMKTIAADGMASQDELKFLQQTSKIFELDPEKFRSMLESYVPVSIHSDKDINMLFGIDEKTDTNKLSIKLNNEYRKWNSRITNADEKIRQQANLMIELITQAKKMYSI